jgi:hypothetical protein
VWSVRTKSHTLARLVSSVERSLASSLPGHLRHMLAAEEVPSSVASLRACSSAGSAR